MVHVIIKVDWFQEKYKASCATMHHEASDFWSMDSILLGICPSSGRNRLFGLERADSRRQGKVDCSGRREPTIEVSTNRELID